MISLRTLTRPMLAAIFVYGGYDAWKDPGGKTKLVSHVVDPVAERLEDTRLPSESESLIKANGVVQMVAGVLLATNIAARPAALALTGSLVPTTLGGHAFWKSQGGGERAAQLTQFVKNVTIAGGLLTAALDTGGRPSVFWSTGRTARRAAHAVGDTLPSHS